jgi:hypothetical protein
MAGPMKETNTVKKLKLPSPQQICTTKIKDTLKTLKTGANDVVVVQQAKEGTYKATPLHIR